MVGEGSQPLGAVFREDPRWKKSTNDPLAGILG
jgi:hypothetical protein